MISLSPETEALARRVADARHVTVDAAVRQALEDSARATATLPEFARPRDPSAEIVAMRRERVRHIIDEIAAMPILDPRSPRAITDDINAL